MYYYNLKIRFLNEMFVVCKKESMLSFFYCREKINIKPIYVKIVTVFNSTYEALFFSNIELN